MYAEICKVQLICLQSFLSVWRSHCSQNSCEIHQDRFAQKIARQNFIDILTNTYAIWMQRAVSAMPLCNIQFHPIEFSLLFSTIFKTYSPIADRMNAIFLSILRSTLSYWFIFEKTLSLLLPSATAPSDETQKRKERRKESWTLGTSYINRYRVPLHCVQCENRMYATNNSNLQCKRWRRRNDEDKRDEKKHQQNRRKERNNIKKQMRWKSFHYYFLI